jgi:hypothetical protein
LEKVSFGNLFKKPFSEIWNEPGYVGFRGLFLKRKEKFRESYRSLWDHPSLEKIKGTFLAEPPAPCATCHKILGF